MSTLLAAPYATPCCDAAAILPGREDLARIFHDKYGRSGRMGWGPRTRLAYRYFTPDDHYEALLDKLVGPETSWLDVGCGRDLFSSNPTLAETLSTRCRRLVGVEPDDNIHDNLYVHEKHQGTIETYPGTDAFDLISLRMVVEHFTNPARSLAGLGRLTRVGGKVVVYTVYKWSPVPLLTRVTPEPIRNLLKRRMWNAEARDTFPVAYLLNTPDDLKQAFEVAGFHQEAILTPDDCRTLANYRWGLRLELATRRLMIGLGMPYPERCLLGIYRRRP